LFETSASIASPFPEARLFAPSSVDSGGMLTPTFVTAAMKRSIHMRAL
jgi:hypothetical protein